MKKILTYAALAFAALAAFSCQGVVEGPDASDGVLILSLDSGEMDTKAADTSFETAIDHFDYFFFADAEGTTPIEGMHGRAEGSSKRLDTQEGADFAPLRARTSYVYVLANYPAALDHSHDWTLAEILDLDVTAPILTGKETETNPITGDTEETGVVSFADNLVMDSWQKVEGNYVYTVELTPAKIQEQRTVSVPLTRLAAKITVDINITDTVIVAGNVWTPCTELLKAYYVNALNNKATVRGTPVKRPEPTDASGYEYVTYPQAYPMTPTPAKGVYKYTTDPVYTYPQKWASEDDGEPYFKIQMPWINDNGNGALSMGSSNFYYKVTIPKPGTDGKWTLERNKWYKVSLTLSMLSTLEDYAEIDFDCTVVPWAESGWTGGSGLSSARFFDVPTREFTLYSDEELAIPYSSSSMVNATFTEISYKYYGDTDGDTFEYVFQDDAFNKTEEGGKTSITLKTTDSNGKTVAQAARETHTYEVSADGKFVNFEHSLEKIYTVREITLTITNKDNKSATVYIHQHPAIELKKHATKNVFVNGWFARAQADVRDADGNLMGVKFGPTTYFDKGWYPYHSTSYWNGSYIKNDSARGNIGSVYGNNNSGVSANSVYTTEIIVSAFNEENNTFEIDYRNATTYNGGTATRHTRHYRIGDPRVPASNHYTETQFSIPDYLYSDKTHRDPVTDDPITTDEDGQPLQDVFKRWEDPMMILIADQGVDANEVIAPHFLISSAMNVMSGALTHLQSVRRAATYQEDGYPAGRWRLPTEAEIAFIVARQKEGSLPWLFAQTYYHCANGRMVYVGMNNNPPVSVEPVNGYNRFVYDLWYWGDEKMDASVYHPNMHEHGTN